MVEVWRDGLFTAGIYGREEGVLVISKYLDGVELQSGYPPGVLVKLSGGCSCEFANSTRKGGD